jgi:hypothetical protein
VLACLLVWGCVDDFVLSAATTRPWEEPSSCEDDEYLPAPRLGPHGPAGADSVPLHFGERARRAMPARSAEVFFLDADANSPADRLSLLMSWQC